MPSRKRVADVLIVVVITLLLFIPAAEIALRVSCAYCTWLEKNEGRFVAPYAIDEKSWYHVNPPNTVINLPLAEFDYEKKINSLGFRDIEHPVLKPEGELRLIAVGDSFTEGWGARFEQTWLNQLDGLLNAEHEGRRLTMISAGVSGSDPFYSYRLLMDKLLPYQPDYVLLVINNSDVMDVILRGGMERFQPDGTVKGVAAPEAPWLYQSSQLARLILFEVFDYTHLLITKPERELKAEQATAKLMELVSLYDTELASRGIDFTLVIAPHHNELKRDRYDRLAPLLDYAHRQKIEVIDTKPYLREKLEARDNRLEDIYWPIDMHFTELGYRYFAEAIAIGLRSKVSRLRSGVGEEPGAPLTNEAPPYRQKP